MGTALREASARLDRLEGLARMYALARLMVEDLVPGYALDGGLAKAEGLRELYGDRGRGAWNAPRA
jgi:hypothetical protein